MIRTMGFYARVHTAPSRSLRTGPATSACGSCKPCAVRPRRTAAHFFSPDDDAWLDIHQRTHTCPGSGERQGWRGGKDHDGHTGMICEGMRHQCWSLVIVSTERGRQVGDEVLHHGLPRSRESPVYRRGHGESVFACASTLVWRGEYRAQTGTLRRSTPSARARSPTPT